MERRSGRRWGRAIYPLLAALALANSGCLLAAAGVAAGGAAATALIYHDGQVCRVYAASFEDTWAATQTALTELGMPLDEAVKEDPLKGTLKSRLADGDKVTIHLEAEPSRVPSEGTVTRVCIRVAIFGDHPVSERILDQVSLHLVPPTLAAPAAAIAPVAGPAPSTPTLTPKRTEPPLLPEEIRKP
jgi:hypothetical protein